MTWNRDYRLAKITFHPDGASAATIEGIQDGGVSANASIRQDVSAGTIYAKNASLESLSPTGQFNVLNIESAINALGLGGACITSATNPGLMMDFEKRDCKAADAGNVHLRYTVGDGVIIPRTLGVDHRGDATLSYEIRAKFDGTNNPVTITHALAPPVLTAASDKRFEMNRAYIGESGYEIKGKRNISFEFNAEVNSEGADSTPYDTVQSITSMLSRLKVSGVDPNWIKADVNPEFATAIIDDQGTGRTLSATPLTIWLKDRNQAATAAAHIKLEMRGLIVPDTIIQGTATSPAECSFEMALVQDGVNAPIVVTTGAAIP